MSMRVMFDHCLYVFLESVRSISEVEQFIFASVLSDIVKYGGCKMPASIIGTEGLDTARRQDVQHGQ